MTLPSKITNAGLILAAIGFVVAVVFEQRIFGRILITFSLYVAVVGIVGGIIFLPLEGAFKKLHTGMRIAAIGFGISSLSFLVALSGREAWANIVFYVGFAIGIIGIITLAFGILRGGLKR